MRVQQCCECNCNCRQLTSEAIVHLEIASGDSHCNNLLRFPSRAYRGEGAQWMPCHWRMSFRFLHDEKLDEAVRFSV